MKRLFLIAALCGGALGAMGDVVDPPTYTLGTPTPAVIRDSQNPSDNLWLVSNPTYVWTAGFSTNVASSIQDRMQATDVRLDSSEVGFSWERSKPEYWLSDSLDAPPDVDWRATYELYKEALGTETWPSGFLFNADDAAPSVYVVNGGTQTFHWVLKDGTVKPLTYVIGSSCAGRPYRIYWTDPPYNAPSISLAGKFVKFFGDRSILDLQKETVTNIQGGVSTITENKVVRGLYIDENSQVLHAVGGVLGQVVMAYYETGNFDKILAVQVIEVCRPQVTALKGEIGTALEPHGHGFTPDGLRANVSAGLESDSDNRGPYLYQHAGSYSYSPKSGCVFPLRPTGGERWKAEIYWMESDPMGVQWPFELDQYDSDWPADGQVFVRGDLPADGLSGTIDTGAKIVIPSEYSATLQSFQEPEGHALAVTGDNRFETKGEGWSMLRLTADDDIWFLPIHSILRSNTDYYTLTPSRIHVGRELLPRGGSRAGTVADKTFHASSEAAGYLYQAASGTQYDANLYYDPTASDATNTTADVSTGGTERAPSALFAIGTGDKDLEVWWSETVQEADMPSPITVPVLPQVYRPVWPEVDEAPQIVIASMEGSANKVRYSHFSAAYFDSEYASMVLPDRRYFPRGTGTVMFWTRPEHYPDPLPASDAGADVSLLSFGVPSSYDADPLLRIHLDEGNNLCVSSRGTDFLSAAMPELEQPNDWTHVALVFDATSSSLYLNGSLAASVPHVADPQIYEYLQNNTIGYNGVRSEDPQTVSGREIAEVLVYSRALDAETVRSESEAVHIGEEAGLTGYFSFRDNEDLDTKVQKDGVDLRTFLDRVGGETCLALDMAIVAPGAPLLDSRVITADSTPSLYIQNDKAQPGYNPNEEHAFIRTGAGGYVTWALRCDLNTAASSPPGVFVEYERDGRSHMQFFHVLLTNETWSSLSAPCVAGEILPGPHPLDYFDNPWLPETTWERGEGANGPGYRDRKGQVWARAAGKLPMHMYYAMQDGFWFPQLDAVEQPRIGDSIPWLSLVDVPVGGKIDPLEAPPAAWTWDVRWPANIPTMKIGQTLTSPTGGLPDVWGAKTLGVVFPDPDTADSVALLTDPTVMRSVPFDYADCQALGLSTEKDGGLVLRSGMYYFNDLPPYISSRLYIDATNKKLCFIGERESRASGTYLYPNVLSAAERQTILDLVSADAAAAHPEEYARWTTAVNGLATAPVVPNTIDRSGTELSTLYGPVDHYALTAMGGTNYVVLIENDASNFVWTAETEAGGTETLSSSAAEDGDPIQMHVLRVEPEYYTGRIIPLEDPVNLLSQQLSVLYTEAFAGKPDDYVFEWRSALPNKNGTIPDDYEDTAIYAPKYDVDSDPEAVGNTRIVIGGQGDTLANMVNKYWICRYRAKGPECPAYSVMSTNWSAWCAPPALAEGWIQRVLNNITPFTQRMTDLESNPAETAVSMLQQAGAPYEGDVALNQDNLTSIGLIQLYETLLNKAETMSILKGDGDSEVCKQLLLAAERLADLYTVLGDEAYADAKNPTVGFGETMDFEGLRTDIDAGSESSSLFCFDNQVPSLLDEELALLRGRTGESAPSTQLSPYYNRLVWNFTRGITAGEVAYAVNYNVEGTQTTSLGEEQAAALYPQGHGDAYGHYLSALKGWYRLLRNPNFNWGEPAQGEMVVADAAINVDYYDEAKFANAALDVAKTAADCVDLTARKAWRDSGTAGVGYLDEDPSRAFGFGEWASRGAYGALCNWVVANSLLPEDANNLDPETFAIEFKDGALTRIDRGTVDELPGLCTAAAAIQRTLDSLDAGLNPLGLSDSAIPFDITPIGANDGGATHFEQIRDRAATALANARAVLDRAQEESNRLRLLQEMADSYADKIEVQEADYNYKLIDFYGSPYSDDIGPAGTYEQGYDGPDLVHYMWMDVSQYGLTDVEDTLAVDAVYYADLGTYRGGVLSMITALGGNITSSLDKLKRTNSLLYERSATGLVVKPKTISGTRPCQGSIQEKYGAFLLQYAKTKYALATYNNAVAELKYQTDWATMMAWGYEIILDLQEVANIAQEVGAISAASTQLGLNAIEYYETLDVAAQNAVLAAVPSTVGAGLTVVTSPRSFAEAAAMSVAVGKVATMAGAKFMLQNRQVTTTLTTVLSSLKDEITSVYEYYQNIKGLYTEVKTAAATVNSACSELQLAIAELNQCVQAYNDEVAEAEVVIEKLVAARKRQVNGIAQLRYNDMYFRLLRNEALDRYSAAFDLAQKYTFLAAQAYDYETALLSSDPASGDAFRAQIIGSRSLGAFDASGKPVVGGHGDTGLAGLLAQMDANWLVLKPRLGINNPQPYATWFSLRSECFRILPGEEGDAAWAQELSKYWVDDIAAQPEFIRYCQPFHSQFGLQEHEPGLVIPFETTIDFAKNLFGNDLAGGDSAYDSTWYATRIAAAGLWFDGYNAKAPGYSGKAQLAATPVAYLVPIGLDCMRVPGLDNGTVLGFNVIDQTIPAPYPIGSTHLDDPTWSPSMADGDLAGADAATRIRRHPSFRAYFDAAGGEPTNAALDCTRLVGRSVWNTKWMLVIPAGGMNADREKALSIFINGSDQNRDGKQDLLPVSDIRIGFKTYSQSGN